MPLWRKTFCVGRRWYSRNNLILLYLAHSVRQFYNRNSWSVARLILYTQHVFFLLCFLGEAPVVLSYIQKLDGVVIFARYHLFRQCMFVVFINSFLERDFFCFFLIVNNLLMWWRNHIALNFNFIWLKND